MPRSANRVLAFVPARPARAEPAADRALLDLVNEVEIAAREYETYLAGPGGDETCDPTDQEDRPDQEAELEEARAALLDYIAARYVRRSDAR